MPDRQQRKRGISMANITGAQIIAQARKYIGEGSARFADAYGQARSADWCCVFVWYCYHVLHGDLLFYGGNKTAWVPNAYYNDIANCKRIAIDEAMAGDRVYFDFNHNGTPDHIGFITGRKSAYQVYTIEGNTDGASSSCVAEKVRNGSVILGIYRPKYADTNAGVVTINRKYRVVNLNGANMRRGASMSYTKTGHIPHGAILHGTKMFRDAKGNIWIWASYKNATGWIPIKYGKRIYLHII